MKLTQHDYSPDQWALRLRALGAASLLLALDGTWAKRAAAPVVGALFYDLSEALTGDQHIASISAWRVSRAFRQIATNINTLEAQAVAFRTLDEAGL